jgi:dTDP-4-dehydrorhamnose reductase
MKTLVLGGSGFVGYYITKYFKGIGTSSSQKEGYIKLDITNEMKVKETLQNMKPDLVINSAAIADVDLCEKEADKAMLVNGTSVEWLAELSSKINAKFIQISTDYVFDGEKGDYTENDKPNPINEYGKSKLVGENNALKYDSIVLRIEMPYGVNLSKNKNVFFESVLRSFKQNKPVNAATDQIISPTFVEDVPRVINALVENNQSGTFHLASKEKLSRYEFVEKMADVFGFSRGGINPTSLDYFKFIAKRPKKTSLNIDKISKIVNIDYLEENFRKIKNAYFV